MINELERTNDTMLESEQILSIKGKQDENASNNIAGSYSSKPPEIIQQNEAGITHFDGLYVDIVPFPRKIANDPLKEKSAKVRIIHKGSAASHQSSSSKNTIQTRESTFLLDNNTCNLFYN